MTLQPLAQSFPFAARRHPAELPGALLRCAALLSLALLIAGCGKNEKSGIPKLHWYVFNEPSGAFREAARRCSEIGDYRLTLELLPADSDQQREQLARRLAAHDRSIDLIGMDVIWTAEFAQAGWILPWTAAAQSRIGKSRFPASLQSALYSGKLWAVPFTTNAQLLWYRTDRVAKPPETWNEMIDMADAMKKNNLIQVQGERYEGLTVFFISLLASGGGSILTPTGQVSLATKPTEKALEIMHRLASSPAAPPALSTMREDQSRLAFEAGRSAFMVNYTYVWPSALNDAPEIAAHMGWARWPRVFPDLPSRVTIGGINIGVAAFSRHPQLAFRAAECLAGENNQQLAAENGGLPPTIVSLYDDPAVRRRFPFADLLRETLNDAVQRPKTPLYTDISLAISHTLHPMRSIDPDRDLKRLRSAVNRALHSEGLL